MLLLMPIKVLPRDYEFEYRPDSLLWYCRISLTSSGKYTTKHTTRNDLNFIRLSITATLHASHRKGRMSTVNDTNDLRICKLNLSCQVKRIIRYKHAASL